MHGTARYDDPTHSTRHERLAVAAGRVLTLIYRTLPFAAKPDQPGSGLQA
jgi:hypothetical protein